MKKMEIIAIRKKLMDLEGRTSNIWIPGTLEREKPRSGTEVVKDRSQKNSFVMNKEHPCSREIWYRTLHSEAFLL